MLSFVPGYPPSPQRLLARFLPPLAEGVAARYLDEHTPPGALVLDPFGQSPQVALEALHLGRRVVVANFNPVSRLALSLAVRPPAGEDLTSALALLAETRTGGQLLEEYLRGLYLTRCAECGVEVSADSFEWDLETDGEAPAEKTYHCPTHGLQRSPADVGDRALAGRFARQGPDYHYLLHRVAPPDDPERSHAEDALAMYPPRALAAIATALQRLDALKPDPEPRRLLCALLVAAFDAACPLAQERPRQLAAPKRFSEHNFWLALDSARAMLAGSAAGDRSRTLPELLSSAAAGLIHAHAGPVHTLMSALPAGSCAAIASAIPRPNQAYWTLSALWSAWLWGYDSSTHLRTVLRRRRYDWSWHAEALRQTLAAVRPALVPDGRFIGLLSESEPGFNASVLAAADAAAFAVRGAALRADTAEAQIVWEPTDAPPSSLTGKMLDVALKNTARELGAEALRARGEPSRWITLHFGAWRGLAEKRLLAAVPEDPITAVNHALEPVFRDTRAFMRLDAQPDDDPATGMWCLPDSPGETVNGDLIWQSRRPDEQTPAPSPPPLADRVEAEVLRLLSALGEADEYDLLADVCAAFPGAQTPGRGLVLACLASYGEHLADERWRLRLEDFSAQRAEELQGILAELRTLGTRHEYELAGANPLEWREEGQTVYLFAVITSAAVGGHLLGEQTAARRRFLALPGGRAGLLEFKLRRNPLLRAALRRNNWVVLKFRHIRRMAADAGLTRATLEPAFYEDPLQEARQLKLLD